MIPDQKDMWNKKHAAGEHETFRDNPSTLALLTEPKLPSDSKILDLGCGVGRDAVFFAKKGHQVTATDFSDVIIQRNKELFKDSNVTFSILDMQKPLPYENSSFDVVFSSLSLHYYDHKTTQRIVEEAHRILSDGGLFAFACKSTHDFHHGNGKEVEESVFVSDKGHVRHLFSLDYAKELTAGLFLINYLDEVEEEYSGEKSVMIQCIAKKTAKNETV